MSSLILEKTSFNLDWITILRRARKVGAYIIVFGIGGWVARINDHAADLPYKTQATAKYEAVQRVAGKNPVATVNCLKRKSAIATTVAKEAVKAATTDADVPVPNVKQIPNCQPAPAATPAPVVE